MSTPRERAVALAADLTGSDPSEPHIQGLADAIEPRIDTMPEAEYRKVLIDEMTARMHARAELIRAMGRNADRDAA